MRRNKNIKIRIFLCILFVVLVSVNTNLKSSLAKASEKEESKHWSYQPVVRPEVPVIRRKNWVRTPIDAFVLTQLESKSIKPSEDADRASLIRRVYLDVWGLLPSPEETREFVSDNSPNAYEKVVDRLLASAHYGERWGRHWLDLTRYADSDGYNQDGTRKNAWRYRDYVIRSFNEDKPYDRFIREQLAGDEIWPGNIEAYTATGFLRNYPDEFNARDLNLRRQEILNDLTDTTGSVFLAATVSCARCHEHKADPIEQEDYYKFQAFFANVSAKDDVPALKSEELAEYQKKLALWQEKTKDIRERIDSLLKPLVEKRVEERILGYTPDTRASILKAANERTPYDRWIVHRAQWTLGATPNQAIRELKGDEQKKYEQLQAELKKFADTDPGELPAVSGMTELGPDAPPTHLLSVGSYKRPESEVEPRFLPALTSEAPSIKPTAKTSGRRTALANWIASPNNPLTPRVIVNRIWSYYFGRGIVESASDFGSSGQKPTNPKLLDWLADEFVKNGWSLKKLQRLILLSSVYRQSSSYRAAPARADSANVFLWRFPRKRLESEAIRDASLTAAGLLEEKAGGPGVFPPLPNGLSESRAWTVTKDTSEHNRRSVYVFVRRNLPYPLLEVFDAPSTQVSCPRRETSITAPQALALFNSEIVYQWSQALAGRLIREAGPDNSAQIEKLFLITYSRSPNKREVKTAQSFLSSQREIIAKRLDTGKPLALPVGYQEKANDIDRAEAAALVDLCHAMLNSNEFVYRF